MCCVLAIKFTFLTHNILVPKKLLVLDTYYITYIYISLNATKVSPRMKKNGEVGQEKKDRMMEMRENIDFDQRIMKD